MAGEKAIAKTAGAAVFARTAGSEADAKTASIFSAVLLKNASC